jgi:hypothetical protein
VGITFLTPSAALFALAALVPLVLFALRERRARAIRRELGLGVPPTRARMPLVVSLAPVPVLLALAATQPVLETSRSHEERSDAEIFVVLDTSRSMLAAAGTAEPTRFERSSAIASRLRQSLPEIPMGLASMTDRALPHLFPTTDARVFATTLRDSLAVDRPPAARYAPLATSLDSLAAVPRTNFFSPSAERRLLVVLTDGEADPVEPDLARAFRRQPRINVVFVRTWDAEERIYETGVAEAGYRPNPELRSRLADAAALVAGRVLAENDFGALLDTARSTMGEGPTRRRELDGERLALMPYVTLAALVPLALVLWRRNV